LCFASTTANFTEFTVGEQLAVDGNHGYTVAVEGERILFPNENVAIGQRALVVITPDNTTKAENHE
jgi:succinylglutamate desuccinylase